MTFTLDVPKGRIKSGFVEGEAFDDALETLESNNSKIIAVPKFAKLRMQEGKNSYCSQNGARTSEDFLYRPGDNFFYWSSNSQINKNAKVATSFHRNGNEFYLNEEQETEALKGAIKIPFDYKRVPTNELHNDKIFSQIYGKIAKEYGLWLFEEAEIKDTGFWNILNKDYINKQTKPFVRKNWFRRLSYDSVLVSNYRCLNDGGWVRGVCEDATASEPKQKNLYTSDQVKIALIESLKQENLTGLERKLVSSFLRKLKQKK